MDIEACQIDFFRSLTTQGLFLVACQIDEHTHDLSVWTRDLTVPDLDAFTMQAIRERKVPLYVCASFHSIFLCPWPEHRSGYVYHYLPRWETSTFVCPACATTREEMHTRILQEREFSYAFR